MKICWKPANPARIFFEAALTSFEREMLVEAIKASAGKMAAAARQLGITERQMMSLRVRKYGILPEAFR